MLPDNLGYLFDTALALTPSKPAVFQGETVLTYAELDARSNRLANALAALGVTAGDRVALLFNNDFRFLETLFGIMRLGAVAVPLNIRMGDEALRYVAEDSEAAVMVAGAALAERGRDARGPDPGHQTPDRRRTRELAARLPTRPCWPRPRRRSPAAPLRFDEVCMQPYTSGSTGKPKGVLLTHGGQIWNADIMRKSLLADDTERALIAVPLYHKNAMAGAVKPFLLAGGSLVILPGFDALEVIRAIDRYKVTYLTGVPAMYKMILAEKDALAQHDVTSVRYAVCGSAEVPEELLDEFRRVFGAPIGESYGLTEGGPVPIVNSRWGLKKRNSCGLAFPGCDCAWSTRRIARWASTRSASWSLAIPGSPRATGSCRRPPPRNSAAAGSTPAISCGATPTATTTSWAAATT